MMMAMIRLDLPSVFAYGGSIRPGCFRGRDVTIQDVYEAIGAHVDREDEPRGAHRARVRGAAGQGLVREHVHGQHDGERLGGARSDRARHGLARGRGPRRASRSSAMPPPCSSTRSRATGVRRRSSRRRRSRTRSPSPPPLGGSTNACLHVPALAGEAGIEFGLADIDRISRRTPQIAEMRPAGRFMMQDLHVEGGVPGRDARAARRRSPRRRRDDRDGPDDRRGAGRRGALAGAAHAGAAHRRGARQADRRLRRAVGQPRPGRGGDQGREPGCQPSSRARRGCSTPSRRPSTRSPTGGSWRATSSSSATRARRAARACRR